MRGSIEGQAPMTGLEWRHLSVLPLRLQLNTHPRASGAHALSRSAHTGRAGPDEDATLENLGLGEIELTHHACPSIRIGDFTSEHDQETMLFGYYDADVTKQCQMTMTQFKL